MDVIPGVGFPALATPPYVLMYKHSIGKHAMSIKTLSSREFQQNASQAQKAAKNGPVFITSRGRPVHVLLSINEYCRITGKRRSIVDALAMPGLADIELEIPKRTEMPRVPGLS
jgi:prevent-host-death family protein